MENTNTNTKNCRLCKKDVTIDLFEKNGKILKTCDTCRSIVRESKRMKRMKLNSESDNSGSDTEKQPETVVAVQPRLEEINEQLVPETPLNSPAVEDDPAPLEPPKLKRSARKTTPPAKQEKNLPSTKRQRKPRTKQE